MRTVYYTMDATALTQSFKYESSTHTFDIRWTSLGNTEAQTLIFIHGTPWSSWMWKPFAIALSRQYHVYLLDRPGFGESPPEKPLQSTQESNDPMIKYDSDLARQSEVFAALFKSWQEDWSGQKPHVIVHDNAGLLSLRAHLVHDCQYASLCLINVVAIGPFGQTLFKAIAEDPDRFERLPDMAFEGILESYIRNAAYFELPGSTMETLKAPWLREAGKAGFIRELCQANSRNTDAVEGRYGEVGMAMPVKVIWGANDDWIPVKDAHRLGEALNAKEVVTIEKAGHLSMIDQPGQVGVEFARWLSTV